jgi:hypothetical protein
MGNQMKVLVSGLSQLDLPAYFGGNFESTLEWCEATCFVDALASSIHGTKPQRAVWLYRAPWTMAGRRVSAEQDSESVLAGWLAEQRLILKSRQALGDLLILVNVDRVSATELLAMLGIVGSDQASSSLPARETISGEALAKLFEWVAPSYWEVFESLESAAWLPHGEPVFRTTLRAPSESSLFELLNILQAGLALPGHMESLAAAQDSLAGLQRDLEVSIKSQADRDALLIESESLLLQLHQVQETLESVLAESDENSAGFERERVKLIAEKEALSSELFKSRETLKGSEARSVELQQALALSDAKAQAENQALVNENDSLLLQLHQVQEDLEHYFSAHQSLLETAEPLNSTVSMTGEGGREPPMPVAEKEKEKAQSRMLALLSAPVLKYVKRSRAEKKLQLQMIFVEQSGFFDRQWYLQMYPDVLASKIDPIKHYLKFGWEEQRDPSTRFSTSHYLNTYPDIKSGGVNPLIHYIKFGAAEGREPRAPWGSANSR